MKLIWKYLMKYKKWFLLDFISVFGFALVELGIPTIISDMIDHGIETQDIAYLYSRFGLMALISVIGVSGVVLLGYCCSKILRAIFVMTFLNMHKRSRLLKWKSLVYRV